MGELRPVYCRHCGQTFLSDQLEKCDACGKVGGVTEPTEATAAADLVARKQAEPTPPGVTAAQVVQGALELRRNIRIIAAGVVCLGLGLLLIFVPSLRDDPRRISLNDVVRGLAAMLVGLFLTALFWLPLLLGRRSARKDEDSNLPPAESRR